jgi:hypothetical protein
LFLRRQPLANLHVDLEQLGVDWDVETRRGRSDRLGGNSDATLLP